MPPPPLRPLPEQSRDGTSRRTGGAAVASEPAVSSRPPTDPSEPTSKLITSQHSFGLRKNPRRNAPSLFASRETERQPEPTDRESQEHMNKDRRQESNPEEDREGSRANAKEAPSGQQEPHARRAPTGQQRDDMPPSRDGLGEYIPFFKKKAKELLSPWVLLKHLVVAFLFLHALRFFYTVAKPDLFESPIARLDWYGWGDWRNNIGQLFPSPLLHPLGVLSDDQYSDLRAFLHDQSSSTEAAVKKLEAIIPKVVHVKHDKKKNKLIIGDEFWHALKDLMQTDDSILTLDSKRGDISNTHWNAVLSRLKKAGIEKSVSSTDIQTIAERTMSRGWHDWVRNNKQTVGELLGQNLPDNLRQDIVSIAEKHVSDRLSSINKSNDNNLQDVVVSREEFLAEVGRNMAQQKKDIDSQLDDLRSSLKDLVAEAARSATTRPQPSSGMSQARIVNLVYKAVAEAIGNAQLEATANSRIAEHFDKELRRRVNFFSPGNGALIDVSMTSPTWDSSQNKPALGTWPEWFRPRPRFQTAKYAALTSWEEAGECWCAGNIYHKDKNGTTTLRPADISVMLGSLVIPQNVVMEHIDPFATLDPGAMPKEIEVWGAYNSGGSKDSTESGKKRRERLVDWMEATFPGHYDHPLVQRGWIKLGQFTYQHHPREGGIQVLRLSQELVRLEAATDQVLIRALSNHGGEDHTCFYRIRMYGDLWEVERESKSKSESESKSKRAG
ncbi:hypothetical protein QBC46DRAFT_400347 [Diplogelasinospora grovesii]|uniref:SUN domain-containing protein n=1 Tax=Diplogelasinospora grovesii TaxID=303347 RepID=A0AAN6MXV6_9PEZI|nr:hypothetical protein QBC46DRAFT_400347 [Diplogelasinospora grovesii]